MNNESIDKEIVYWNIHTFNHLVNIASIYEVYQERSMPKEYHLKIRDFYYQPNFYIFGVKQNRPSFIKQSAQYLKNFMSFNQLAYLQSISF